MDLPWFNESQATQAQYESLIINTFGFILHNT